MCIEYTYTHVCSFKKNTGSDYSTLKMHVWITPWNVSCTINTEAHVSNDNGHLSLDYGDRILKKKNV